MKSSHNQRMKRWGKRFILGFLVAFGLLTIWATVSAWVFDNDKKVVTVEEREEAAESAEEARVYIEWFEHQDGTFHERLDAWLAADPFSRERILATSDLQLSTNAILYKEVYGEFSYFQIRYQRVMSKFREALISDPAREMYRENISYEETEQHLLMMEAIEEEKALHKEYEEKKESFNEGH